MTDEMEHASRFSLLYAATKKDMKEEKLRAIGDGPPLPLAPLPV